MIILIVAAALIGITAIILLSKTTLDLQKRLDEEIINNERLSKVINEIAKEKEKC